jgi:hypothetical protein
LEHGLVDDLGGESQKKKVFRLPSKKGMSLCTALLD